MCKCDICDKEYDDDDFTGRIVNLDTDSEIKHVCRNCFEKEIEKNKYWYKSYAPRFANGILPGLVHGVPISLVVSDNKYEIMDFLIKHTKKGYILCSSYETNAVVDVKEDKSEWWFRGYLSTQIDKPFVNWKVIAGVKEV